MARLLKKSFFEKPTLKAAQELLGSVLVRRYRGRTIKGIITETEAYVGPDDLASHASRGRTKRNSVMFADAGKIYVYLIYGMHHCLNIVTEKKGYPSAILIRGAFAAGKHPDGPGKVSRYFHIDKSFNEKTLSRKTGLWIERGLKIPPSKIKRSPRIGVDYAGDFAKKPWRFSVKIEKWTGIPRARSRR